MMTITEYRNSEWREDSTGFFIEHHHVHGYWVCGFRPKQINGTPCAIKYLARGTWNETPTLTEIVGDAERHPALMDAYDALSKFRQAHGDNMVTRMRVEIEPERGWGSTKPKESKPVPAPARNETLREIILIAIGGVVGAFLSWLVFH